MTSDIDDIAAQSSVPAIQPLKKVFDATALLTDYLKCQHKAFLKLRGEVGKPTVWQEVEALRAVDFQCLSRQHLASQHSDYEVLRMPASLRSAHQSHALLIIDATSVESERRWGFDAIQRQAEVSPIRCISSQKPPVHNNLSAVTSWNHNDQLIYAMAQGIIQESKEHPRAREELKRLHDVVAPIAPDLGKQVQRLIVDSRVSLK